MTFSNNTSTKWIIGVLAVMNIALLSFILFMRPSFPNEHRGENRGDRGLRAAEYLKKELKLDENQSIVFRDLQKRHFRESKEVFGKIKNLKKEMFNALNLETPDTSKANTIATQIGQEHQLLEEMMIIHYLQLKDECTSSEQLKKLEQVFHKVINRKKSRGKKSSRKKHGRGCK